MDILCILPRMYVFIYERMKVYMYQRLQGGLSKIKGEFLARKNNPEIDFETIVECVSKEAMSRYLEFKGSKYFDPYKPVFRAI